MPDYGGDNWDSFGSMGGGGGGAGSWYEPPASDAGSGMSLGQAGVGLQGIGAIIGAIGAIGSAYGQRQSLRAQADIANINAQASERAAQAALAAGQHEEQASSIRTANLKSTQQATFAANGVDLGEGSAARVLTSTDVMGAIDKNTIAANAVRKAWGYRTQETNYNNDALMKRSQAGAISPLMAGGTSLLNSAGSVASNWYAVSKGITPAGYGYHG